MKNYAQVSSFRARINEIQREDRSLFTEDENSDEELLARTRAAFSRGMSSRKRLFDAATVTSSDEEDDDNENERREKRWRIEGETSSAENSWSYQGERKNRIMGDMWWRYQDDFIAEPSFPSSSDFVPYVSPPSNISLALEKDASLYYGHVGGMPLFMKWCFFTPWRDPKTDVLSDYGERSFKPKTLPKKIEHPATGSDNYDPRAGAEEQRMFHPHYSTDDRSTLLKMNNSRLTIVDRTLIRTLSFLTEMFVRNDGFLPARAVFHAIQNGGGEKFSAGDMLRLLSFVPRENLRRRRDYDLNECLTTILQTITLESSVAKLQPVDRFVYGENSPSYHYMDTPPREEIVPMSKKEVTLLHSNVARVWFLVRTIAFYSVIVPEMLEMPLINIYRKLLRSNDKLISQISCHPTCYYHDRAYSYQTSIDREVSITRDVYVILLARLSRDFFRSSFLRIIYRCQLRTNILARLFVNAMETGNVVVAVPLSLFASRDLVKDRCEPLLRLCARNDNVGLTELALLYMLHVRGVPIADLGGDDRKFCHGDKQLFDEHGEFVKATFGPRSEIDYQLSTPPPSPTAAAISVHAVSSTTTSPNDRSYADVFGRNARDEYRRDKVNKLVDCDLVSLSLKSLLLSHGLVFVLREITRLDLPSNVLSRVHAYFYRTSWNFLRVGRRYW